MDDYPKTLAELEARFPTEEACREYLFYLRWPDGLVVLVVEEQKLGKLEKCCINVPFAGTRHP